MRLLALSDLHSRIEKLEQLCSAMIGEKFDAVVFCGDFTNEGSTRIAGQAIGLLEGIGKVLAVPGNVDSKQVLELLESKKISIHKKAVEFKGHWFAGFGGAKPVYCHYPFNVGELEAKKFFQTVFGQIDAKKTIIVSHSPPSGTGLDIAKNGARIGLDALKNAIAEKQPLLCLCGHVHEKMGEAEIGGTKVINPGPLMGGNAAIINIENNIVNIERVKL